jgi:hypothetical protein
VTCTPQPHFHSQDDATLEFTFDEVEHAVDQTNFSKGLGPGVFDGLVIAKDGQVKRNVIKFLVESLKTENFP